MRKKHPFNKKSILSTPDKFGVYIFYDKNHIPIYVGKANSLKNRLRTYLNTNLYEKTDRLVANTKTFSYILVDCETEAFLLEARLIKKLIPRYNVLSKDGKSPLYITITNDIYPILQKTRNPGGNHKYIYGPFLSLSRINNLLRLIRRVVPYSTHLPSHRSCIYKQMGLCDPCPSEIVYPSSQANVPKMQKIYKNNIRNLKLFLNGNLKRLENEFLQSMRKYSYKQMYEEANLYKNKLNAIRTLKQPVGNIELYTNDPYYLSKTIKKRLIDLQILLSGYLSISDLKRIECYDISHISGASSAGSMVVFISGSSDKKHYRRFHLKKSINNDVASLAEIAQRRVKHLEEWGSPDLIIVDGGKPQTNIFKTVFDKYNIPTIGMAKRYEELIIPKVSGGYFQIRPKGDALLLLQKIRNESHRFAVSYHHKLMSKSLLKMVK